MPCPVFGRLLRDDHGQDGGSEDDETMMMLLMMILMVLKPKILSSMLSCLMVCVRLSLPQPSQTKDEIVKFINGVIEPQTETSSSCIYYRALNYYQLQFGGSSW